MTDMTKQRNKNDKKWPGSCMFFIFWGQPSTRPRFDKKIAQDDTWRQMRNDKIRCQTLKTYDDAKTKRQTCMASKWQTNDKLDK